MTSLFSRWFAWLIDAGRDVRYAFRTLRRSPGFTVVAVATLAVGIGVNVAVFTVTSAVLFRGFRGIDGNDRIVYIGSQRDGRGCCASYPDYVDWRAQAKSFVDVGAVADLPITFRDGQGLLETYSATRMTANAFRLLGHAPIVGRDFSLADEQPGAAPVVVLSYGFWDRRYGRDSTAIGRRVSINGVPTTIVGVMPPAFAFPQNQDLWLPLIPTASMLQRDARTLWFAFGRMAPGVTIEQARVELRTIGAQLAQAYPDTNTGWVPSPRTFDEFFGGVNARVIYGSLWGAVGFVLLIVCANLANLMLARALGRSREISVRVAVGAGSWRIVRQLLVESTMLSVSGGALGWWIAKWAVRTYEVTANPPTRTWSSQLLDYSMDAAVLTYVVAVAVGTGLLFGLVPALRMRRLDITTALKSASRGSTGASSGRLSALLVIGEVALAVALLSGAGVMLRSVLQIYTADLGVDTKNLVTMFVSLPADTYPDNATRRGFLERLTTRLAGMPGIEALAAANTIPAGGTGQLAYEIPGHPTADAANGTPVPTVTISPEYFAALGVAVLAGREFTVLDDDERARVAMVNEQFARTFWPGEDAIGKRLNLLEDRRRPLVVVGVVSNVVHDVARQRHDPVVYLPYRQRPLANMWVTVRTRATPTSLATPFRQAVAAIDPNLPIGIGPFLVDDRLAGLGNYWIAANNTVLLSIFAAIALLLASVGLYAVIAHSVSQHTQEIGIRIAIGAGARDVLALVMRQGMVPLGIGLVVGLAASLALNHLLTSQLVNVSPTGPAMLLLSSIVLLLAATAGCLIPARRAMRVDPVVVLRAS